MNRYPNVMATLYCAFISKCYPEPDRVGSNQEVEAGDWMLEGSLIYIPGPASIREKDSCAGQFYVFLTQAKVI